MTIGCKWIRKNPSIECEEKTCGSVTVLRKILTVNVVRHGLQAEWMVGSINLIKYKDIDFLYILNHDFDPWAGSI